MWWEGYTSYRTTCVYDRLLIVTVAVNAYNLLEFTVFLLTSELMLVVVVAVLHYFLNFLIFLQLTTFFWLSVHRTFEIYNPC